MLRWSIAFFLVALLAALFGFTDIAAGAAWIGKVLFFVFLACFVIAFGSGMVGVRRRRLLVVRVRNPGAK